MDGPEILCWNERIKAISNLAFNLGGALLAAIAVQLFNNSAPDRALALELVGMAILLWLAYMVLGVLEPEDAE